MVLPSVAEKPASDPFFALAGGPGQSAVEAYPLVGYLGDFQVREFQKACREWPQGVAPKDFHAPYIPPCLRC
jgi:hypothetical protein